MSTALEGLPDLDADAGSGIVARRAVIRWGWRLFRREWRQQLLVLGLLTVAVAATMSELRWYLEDYLAAPFGVYGERGPRCKPSFRRGAWRYSARYSGPGRAGRHTCGSGPSRRRPGWYSCRRRRDYSGCLGN